MFIFVDETGNTGDNIFDENQPYFLTAALATRTNFDITYKQRVQSIAHRQGVEQLHATHLDHSNLDQIGPYIYEILKTSDARILISIVEKKYLLACKMVDTIFDSGENLAVPWHVYNIRQLRLILVFKLYYIVNEEIVREFWDCLMDKKIDRARKRFQNVCDKISSNVDALPDARSRTIFSEALDWAKQHPEEIYFHPSGKLARLSHMPNVIGFINLLDSIEKQSNLWNRRVKLIKHDRQTQFEKSLEFWHERFKNASSDPLYLPGGEKHVLQKVMGSQFQISSAHGSPGIQIADIVLWSFRRHWENRNIPNGLFYILKYMQSRARISELSFAHVSQALNAYLEQIFAADLAPEKLEESRKIIEYFETQKNQKIEENLRSGD